MLGPLELSTGFMTPVLSGNATLNFCKDCFPQEENNYGCSAVHFLTTVTRMSVLMFEHFSLFAWIGMQKALSLQLLCPQAWSFSQGSDSSMSCCCGLIPAGNWVPRSCSVILPQLQWEEIVLLFYVVSIIKLFLSRPTSSNTSNYNNCNGEEREE